jgi:hypothetical protein
MGSMSTDRKSASLKELLDSAADIARSENRRTEEVLKDALSQYERGKELASLSVYGREQARRMSLKAVDIDRAIHDDHKQQTRSR